MGTTVQAGAAQDTSAFPTADASTSAPVALATAPTVAVGLMTAWLWNDIRTNPGNYSAAALDATTMFVPPTDDDLRFQPGLVLAYKPGIDVDHDPRVTAPAVWGYQSWLSLAPLQAHAQQGSGVEIVPDSANLTPTTVRPGIDSAVTQYRESDPVAQAFRQAVADPNASVSGDLPADVAANITATRALAYGNNAAAKPADNPATAATPAPSSGNSRSWVLWALGIVGVLVFFAMRRRKGAQ